MSARADRAALAALAEDAKSCTRCPLYRNATQTVFGEGPADHPLMLVGEQPGDREDIEGHPFVGPAGKLLDRALAEAGIERDATWLTNVVKHFKNEPRGRKRLHRRPDRYEIDRCRWWLDQEIALVKPSLIVALGVTAAEALTGRRVVLSRLRGGAIELPTGHRGLITTHPSAILRVPDAAAKRTAFAALVKDLKIAQRLAA
ncbi:MAG: UdgX family uracil-DNA binding protein [Alphaproteobacteria bacterium]|nr:UdgX family uracil-DNA binding protein [Alphaproteobacteria bacterium]MCW5740627.1 UdgX family uracil-DNA binding protein [Alphaproteobacteria bacterium]